MSNLSLKVEPIIALQYFSIEYLVNNSENNELDCELLKQQDIIPSNWKISNSTQNTKESRLYFTNGISITKKNQSNSIIFSEPLNANICKIPRIIDVAYNYFLSKSLFNFSAIYVNFQTYVRFEAERNVEKEAIEKYIISKLSPGFSLGSSLKPYQADLNFFFKKDRASIKFNIQKADLSLPNDQIIPSISYHGVFFHNIELSNKEEIQNLIFSWEKDFNVYMSILKGFL